MNFRISVEREQDIRDSLPFVFSRYRVLRRSPYVLCIYRLAPTCCHWPILVKLSLN